MEYQFTNDPERFRFAHQTSFVKRHTGLSTKPGIRSIVTFFRQIFGMKNPGVLGCMRPGKKASKTSETSRALVARDATDVRPPVERPTEERPDKEEAQLTRKRWREEEPPACAASSTLTNERPIAALPLTEGRPPPSATFLEATTVACAETSRGRPYFGRDPEKVER
ncbi:hypothetical protein OROHE_022317 [Orobanche hederae]